MCPPASTAQCRSFPCTIMASFFTMAPKQPSADTSSLSHVEEPGDTLTLRLDGQTCSTALASYLDSFQLIVTNVNSLCRVGRQSSLLELDLLVFDWLMGTCLFWKCCEQVNEPWICAERQSSRLKEQVAGQQDASSLNPLMANQHLIFHDRNLSSSLCSSGNNSVRF